VAIIKRGSVIWEKLVDQAPDVPGFRQDLAGFYFYLSMASFAFGNRTAAIDQMYTSAQMLKTLMNEHPQSQTYRDEWALVVSTLGEMYEAVQQPSEAIATYQGGLAEYADSVALCNQAARFYATYPDPLVRRPDEAVRLGRRATELEPRDGLAWSTLGFAYYRARQWQEAVSALERSAELRDGGDAWDWFYLAMALEQLGQPDAARKWFAQGKTWAQTPRNLRQVRELYQEAADVLGEPGPDAK
jgi:tetratricopeptide (TPR) repeat protein